MSFKVSLKSLKTTSHRNLFLCHNTAFFFSNFPRLNPMLLIRDRVKMIFFHNLSSNFLGSISFFSESASSNRKFQIFQKCFQNIQLFSINPIKCLNVYADNYNHDHNILRLFDVWPNFPFTFRKKKPDYQ